MAPANLVLGNGSNEIIEFVGHAYFAPGVDVVVSQFCFAIYPLVAKMFGANLVTVPAKNHGHDLPAMLRAITPQTRVVFVANPNNPTGTLVPREEVIAFVNEIPDHVLLVMDEAYLDVTENKFKLEDPVKLAGLIKQHIFAVTKLTASAGVAPCGGRWTKPTCGTASPQACQSSALHN